MIRRISLLALATGLLALAGCSGELETNGQNDNAVPNHGNGGESGIGSCQVPCDDAEDCGEDPSMWLCSDNTCESTTDTPVEPCRSDEYCTAQLSGWEATCEDAGECPDETDCIEYGDERWCVQQPGEDETCEDEDHQEITVTRLEDGEETTVCGRHDVGCDGLSCFEHCQSDDECDSPGADECRDDGTCGCADDDSCNEVEGADVCLDDGSCVCDTDETCADEVDGTDVCVDHECRCSTDEVCPEGEACL